MIYQIVLVLSISVAWICLAETDNSVISPIIEKSASLARISAAVSIHKGIYSEKSIVQEVTAEFLDISSSVAKELLEHDYRSLFDNMEKFYGSLSKIPAKLTDGDELIETLNFLMDMKVNQEYLRPGTIGDQTGHFEKTKQIMVNSRTSSNKILNVLGLETAAELLRNVSESEGQAMKAKEIKDILSNLRRSLSLTESQLNLMVNYTTVLKDYLSLESLSDDLQSVENAAKIAGRYSKTIEELDPFRNDLIAASKDTDKIKEATNEILKYSESIQNLFQKSTLLNLNARKYDGKMITSGLLGYKDLDNIWKDFENPWFRQNVLSNLDSTSLKEGLKSLKPFVSALDSLIPSKRLDDKKDTKTILDLAKKISKIHEVGSKVKNAINVTTPFKEVSNCIEPLKPIQNPPDQAMLQRIVDYSGEVVRNVKTFSKLMDDLNKNGLQSIITICKDIKTNIELVIRLKNDSLIEKWDETRKLEKDHELAGKLQWIADQLDEVSDIDLFVEDRAIDYTVIQSVSTVFEGTNVESVLNCIQRSYVDNLIGMLGFVDQTDTLKNQKTEFMTATDFIKNLSKMQTSFRSVINKTKSVKVSQESQKLMNSNHFKEVGSNSKVIGGSVAALRAIETISKAENSIRSVVEMESDVKFEVQKSLGLKSTDALIHEMKQAQTSVGEILKVLEAKRIDSISEIQSIFISLSKLKNQTDIEDDNIPTLALEMSNKTDPKLQNLAKELFSISQLDMRFANHQKSFDVRNSLESTKNMLVNFLQTYIDEQEAEKRRAMENSSNSNYLVPILIACLVIGLVATAVICFICWYRGFGLWHFVESGDLESGNHGKARKRKFGFRKKGQMDSKSKMSKPKKKDKTESKSKMSKPKEQEKKSEDEKKKEETKEKSKTSQISQIPKSAEQ
ncbi:hypothetical protein B9Z55_003260 [Caenorhabditis nigoni]|uniref:Domain of unknown function WSN domain-containing protein n=1 Tax=Caenorhabditis nigoni TaxID=1611254 RepID=A0A2G5VPE1_9PELO|nr:hypothetical protein B9Z55_003260 [Caenorhabditis nigoni]